MRRQRYLNGRFPWIRNGNHSAPVAHQYGRIIKRRKNSKEYGRRSGRPRSMGDRNTGYWCQNTQSGWRCRCNHRIRGGGAHPEGPNICHGYGIHDIGIRRFGISSSQFFKRTALRLQLDHLLNQLKFLGTAEFNQLIYFLPFHIVMNHRTE